MSYVYAVWEMYPFAGPTILVGIFSTREKATDHALGLTLLLPEDSQPEYDDYGLIEGVEYTVQKIAVDDPERNGELGE
jgi:hypothetical protein